MDITFRNKKLAKLANNDKKLFKELGQIRGKKFKQRLDDLKAAVTLEDVRYLPGRFHELKENRKGQWGCDLDQPYRLIFKPQENPIPVNEDGQFIWSKVQGIEILEIINYHKEK